MNLGLVQCLEEREIDDTDIDDTEIEDTGKVKIDLLNKIQQKADEVSGRSYNRYLPSQPVCKRIFRREPLLFSRLKMRSIHCTMDQQKMMLWRKNCVEEIS